MLGLLAACNQSVDLDDGESTFTDGSSSTMASPQVGDTWIVCFYPDSVPQELNGTAIEGTVNVSTSYANPYGNFSSDIVLIRP